MTARSKEDIKIYKNIHNKKVRALIPKHKFHYMNQTNQLEIKDHK